MSYAASGGHLGIVKMLLDHGCDPNEASPPPIVWATYLEHDAMFDLLRERGAAMMPSWVCVSKLVGGVKGLCWRCPPTLYDLDGNKVMKKVMEKAMEKTTEKMMNKTTTKTMQAEKRMTEPVKKQAQIKGLCCGRGLLWEITWHLQAYWFHIHLFFHRSLRHRFLVFSINISS